MREPSGQRRASLLRGGKPHPREGDRASRPCRHPATHGPAAAAAPDGGRRIGRCSLLPSRPGGERGCVVPLARSILADTARAVVAAESLSCPSRRCSLRGSGRSTSRARNPRSDRVELPARGDSPLGARKRVERVSTPRELRPRAPLGGRFPAREAIPEKRSTGDTVRVSVSFPSRFLQVVERDAILLPTIESHAAHSMRRRTTTLQGGDELGTRSPLGLGSVCVRSERNLAQKRE